jgi:uncharacterized protein (DUF58 family)
MTGTGRIVAVLAVVLIAAGVALRYPAILAFGIALALLMAIALIWIFRRPRVRAERRVSPERVTVGETALSELTVTNLGRRRTTGGIAVEAFGGELLSVELPALDPGQSELVIQPLPTDQRGVFQVGPLLVARSDPFGLLRVGQEQRDLATLFVHPRVIHLAPFPSGLHRDLDGPSAGEAPDGGITFQNLREYVEGDDLRLVHWRSYAKTGALMVRHNIDTHQPRSIVILDTRAAVHSAESLENAIEAAASIVSASMMKRYPFRLETTCGTTLDNKMTKAKVFDLLAGLVAADTGSIADAVRRLTRDRGGSSLAVVSGRCSTDDLAVLSTVQRKFEAITIGRIGARIESEITLAPGAVLINAAGAIEFARAWNRRAA